MSDTPPDQKEAGDTPEGPKNPWVSWLVGLILTPVLYVLSVGPAVWLVDKGCLPDQVMFVYGLFDFLPYPFQSVISEYLKWWS